ncbi:hypothetical protein [Enterococcus phage vB_EfaM_Ef2.3]|uniref:Membrane protein n=2 Tax=Kochikohdavirus TaxID=2560160 RepID=A0A9E7MHK2_9CAUD|nr:hypothetical protein [Enterococcus phage vB_EfaM_Ef2.3]USL84194.1 putative membrane protein [Enterococcus phage Sw5]
MTNTNNQQWNQKFNDGTMNQNNQQKEVITLQVAESFVSQILTKEYSVIGLVTLMFYFMFGMFGIFGGAIYIAFTHTNRKIGAWQQVRSVYTIKEEQEEWNN